MTAVEQRIQTVCLLILSAVAVAGAMYWLRPVMIPFVLALFISLGLSAAVDFQCQRFRLPRRVALLTTFVMALLAVPLFGSLLAASVSELFTNAPAYEAHIGELIQRITAALPAELRALTPETAFERISQVSVGTVSGVLLGTTNAILKVLSNSFLVFIFVLYLFLGSSGARKAPGSTWAAIESRIQSYLVAKVVISAVTGFIVTAVLWILGVDLALAFGMFAFLLNFIPSIGSIIATLLPLPVVLMSPDISGTAAALAIAVPGAIQITIGNFVEPRVMGDALDLHPVVVLMSLIFWGMLWGVLGMLLATPITAVLKILFEKLEPTRPLAHLMAGRLESIAGSEL